MEFPGFGGPETLTPVSSFSLFKTHRMFSIRNVTAGCLVLSAACSPAPTADTAGFVYRLGVDTIGVSSVTWAGDKVSGVYVNRVPTTSVVRWNADVDAEGGVRRLERTHTTGATVTERVLITVTGDTAVVEHTRGDSAATRRFAVSGPAIPRNPATDPGLLELRTRHLVKSGQTEMITTIFGTTDTVARPTRFAWSHRTRSLSRGQGSASTAPGASSPSGPTPSGPRSTSRPWSPPSVHARSASCRLATR